MKTVQALSSSLDTGQLRLLSAEESDFDTPAYQATKNSLIHTFSDVDEVVKAYFFTVRDGSIYHLADSLPIDSDSSFHPGRQYEEAPQEAYRIFVGEPLLATKPHVDQWGRWISIYRLLPLQEGGLPIAFGLDFNANLFYSVARIRTFGITVSLLVLLLLAFVSFFAAKSAKQLKIEKDKADDGASLLKTLQLKERKEKVLVETTLQSLGEGVIATDTEGRVVIMNRMAQQLTGWDITEAKGRPLREIYRIVDGHTLTSTEHSWAETVFKTGVPFQFDNYEVRLKRKNDTYILIEDMIYPIIDEEEQITGVVVIFIDGTEKQSQQKELLYLSSHDGLTGLLNRQSFYAELEKLDIPKHYPLVLMLLDINGLKLINDAYGHATGDSLLNEVAIILQRPWHKGQVVGRVDGDEFALFFPNATEAIATRVSEQIHAVLAEQAFQGYALTICTGFAKKEYAQTTMNELHKKAEDDLLRNKFAENQSARLKMVDLLLQSLFKKSQREMEHSKRVGSLAKRFGRYLGFCQEEQEELHTSGVMHDIGKIAVSRSILNKNCKLDSDEWKEIQRHPEIGFNILSSVNQYLSIAEQVLCHHERWDGKGYPNQIAKESIPLYSRILALCDSFDAMTCLRTYRSEVSVREALDEIERCSGTQYDPTLAEQFISMIEEEYRVRGGIDTVSSCRGK